MLIKDLKLGNRVPYKNEKSFTSAYNGKWKEQLSPDWEKFTVYKIPDASNSYKPCDLIYSDHEGDYWVEDKFISWYSLSFNKIRLNQYAAMKRRIKLGRKCFLRVYSNKVNNYRTLTWQEFLEIKAKNELDWKSWFKVFEKK